MSRKCGKTGIMYGCSSQFCIGTAVIDSFCHEIPVVHNEGITFFLSLSSSFDLSLLVFGVHLRCFTSIYCLPFVLTLTCRRLISRSLPATFALKVSSETDSGTED